MSKEELLGVIEDMDNYKKAATYLIDKALKTGDGYMLRALKTLMDNSE